MVTNTRLIFVTRKKKSTNMSQQDFEDVGTVLTKYYNVTNYLCITVAWKENIRRPMMLWPDLHYVINLSSPSDQSIIIM